MNKSNVIIMCLLSLTLGVLGWFWGKSRSQNEHASHKTHSSKAPAQTLALDEKGASKLQPAPAAPEVQNPGANISKYNSLLQQMSFYKQMKQKPLLNKAERAEEKNFYSAAVLDDAKKYLMTPESIFEPEVKWHHQTAVQILIDGLEHNPRVAAAMITDVILDAQLENKKISAPARELMAKDKAELMYHFMALQPKAISKNKMPGPTSQALFENVASLHRENLALSAQEVNQFKSGRW